MRNGHAIIKEKRMHYALKWLGLAAALVVGCGQLDRHEAQPGSPADDRVERLRALQVETLAELDAAADAGGGWLSGRECDGTLWGSLAAAAGARVNLSLVEYAPGRIDRRPAPSCLEDEDGNGRPDSGSTVSRDMLTGYLWGVWRSKDVGALQRLAAYGEAHDWTMGDGDSARTGMRSNLKGLLGRMLHELGGGSPGYRHLPPVYLAAGADYERHLTVLGILLQGEVGLEGLAKFPGETDVNGDMLGTLEKLAAEAPDDALFQAARGVYDGDMGLAMDLLLDEGYVCPSYVRPLAVYCTIHRAFAADIVLRQF